MSSSSSPSESYFQRPVYPENQPKFTRGEKCIFTHIITTFVIIILLIIVYFVHLCMVKHTRNDAYKITRRAYEHSWVDVGKLDYQYVGMVYLNMSMPVVVCNVLLLHKRWSLGPGQCSSMRGEPNMSDYLPFWKIKYKIMEDYASSDIKRTLTHSRFNRADFDNNIGLIEHVDDILGQYYVAIMFSYHGNFGGRTNIEIFQMQ
ncbi:uncharacterized protein LOC142986243 isoform X2 [Anticarsia gemmatalis]|uniref:uncharacterized protein LOC142986243 isoform X2 n=1 Tax=Anticarsia gemmatalis TaxID=129554 RepID=UPI003F759E7A